MIYRWNQADAAPIPSARLVSLAGLREILPPETPIVTGSARAAAASTSGAATHAAPEASAPEQLAFELRSEHPGDRGMQSTHEAEKLDLVPGTPAVERSNRTRSNGATDT